MGASGVDRPDGETSIELLLELLDGLCDAIATVECLETLPRALRLEVRTSLEHLAREALTLARVMGDEEPQGLAAIAKAATGGDEARRSLREELLQRALKAIASERYREAEEILFAALDAFPGNAAFYNHLGLIAWERGEIQRADAFYEKAVAAGFPDGDGVGARFSWWDEHHADFLRALEGRALCLYQLARLDEALPLFESLAATGHTAYAGCRYLAGEVRHLLGDAAAARADYQLSPAEPAVLYNLALAHFECDGMEAATTALLRAFGANQAICELLLGRAPAAGGGGSPSDERFVGYLGSVDYAEEFLEACLPLWRGKAEALRFMERCFDHPLVQYHLHHRPRQAVGEELEEGLDLHCEPDQLVLRGLAQRLLESIVA